MKEKNLVRIGLIFLFIILVVLAAFSEGSGYGGGDSSMHLLISKFSFKHPELFLNHWGKPFFILCSCLFAQFGFFGMTIFNIICALSTAYLAYLLAKEFRFENAWMALLFSLFAPVYFVSIFSGLTEIFFSFILVLGIYLFVRKKYFLSSLLISFLPFARSEGYLVLLIFGFVLLYRKKVSAILLLLTGTFIYSIIGGMHYHDWLWIIHQNPYTNVKYDYGNGNVFHFVQRNEFIFGTSLVVFVILGILSFAIRRNQKRIFFNEATVEELVLLYGSFATYFIAHSIFWWKGWFGSDGLIRVMAGITPLIALLSLRGTNFILSFKNSAVIKVVLFILVVIMPFKQHHFPKQLDYEEATLHEADAWIKKNGLLTNKIFYSHPFSLYELEKDPFDRNSSGDFFSLKPEKPESNVATGDLVIWETHFGPGEGRIPLRTFLDNSHFKMLNSFTSDPAVTPVDKGKYEVYVFQKL